MLYQRYFLRMTQSNMTHVLGLLAGLAVALGLLLILRLILSSSQPIRMLVLHPENLSLAIMLVICIVIYAGECFFFRFKNLFHSLSTLFVCSVYFILKSTHPNIIDLSESMKHGFSTKLIANKHIDWCIVRIWTLYRRFIFLYCDVSFNKPRMYVWKIVTGRFIAFIFISNFTAAFSTSWSILFIFVYTKHDFAWKFFAIDIAALIWFSFVNYYSK